PPAFDDRHLAEVAVDIQRHCSHSSLLVVDDSGEPVGKRHRRIRARSATGQVAGAAIEESPGSKPIAQNGLPSRVLPKAPVPVGRTYARPRTTAGPSRSSFMPRGAGPAKPS